MYKIMSELICVKKIFLICFFST